MQACHAAQELRRFGVAIGDPGGAARVKRRPSLNGGLRSHVRSHGDVPERVNAQLLAAWLMEQRGTRYLLLALIGVLLCMWVSERAASLERKEGLREELLEVLFSLCSLLNLSVNHVCLLLARTRQVNADDPVEECQDVVFTLRHCSG